ncbi:MAG: FmdE family protein [Deltaproteobacteria bacterium]|jgi:formylmethanofuran dehydrogenase subunit E|nr:FmdE family protein [Deltaproteobacteria bacterium]
MCDWKKYVDKTLAFHGHLCSGQILGIRFALAGLKALGLAPNNTNKSVVLFIESDRCVADAIIVVTGITPGQRRIKFKDYGKAAVSFLDLETNQAVRVAGKTEPRAPSDCDPVEFWSHYADEEILTVEKVKIELPELDRPGKSKRHVICQKCGELVNDGREIIKEGKILCRACADEPYYRLI